MVVIGVTGTDGKSTTSYFIQQLLRKSGKKTGLLTTVQFDLGNSSSKNYLRQSTPEAPEIHRLLRQMRDNDCTHAVVEATSHGLSPINNRLGDVHFDAGVLTNISHEHLEFHKTLERYIDDKANLFRALPAEGGRAIINLDEPRRNAFEQASECPVFTYSLTDDSADLYAADIRPLTGDEHGGQEFVLMHSGERSVLQLPLTGRFNVENCLAALLAVSSLPGEELTTYLPFVAELEAIRGRMVPVRQGQPFQVIVDYAHTPGSFQKLFPSLRSQVRGKLIAVFGSAGERDVEKRSIQGKIASEYCDIIILADEDPRGEDPLRILEDIAGGCEGMQRGENLLLIEDRPAAIRRAFLLAGENDLVILLGKGHEGSIIYVDGPVPWDEEQEAIKALRESGYQI
jgi:UDP-N-acetylmuramoyl-L-alanyl-D-glutamate--2,6-diaminopimelate ligase